MTTTVSPPALLSKLILGTSQFGLNYGIANTVGKPTYSQVCEMISCACENGINCLDTATIYGDSEEVIGAVLAELGLQEHMVVSTKIPRMSDSFSSQSAVDAYVEEAVTNSLRLLRLQRLPICLFHTEGNFRYIEALLKVQEKGLVQSVGCSAMTPKATIEIMNSGLAEFIQIPTSALDQRFLRDGVMDTAAKANVTLLVRSVYLQGLLLMPEQSIPHDLTDVLAARRVLRELAGKAGITLEELALRFALSLPAVSSIVIGVDTIKQLQRNAFVAAKGPLHPDIYEAILEIVPTLPDHILMPNQWSRRMPDGLAVVR